MAEPRKRTAERAEVEPEPVDPVVAMKANANAKQRRLEHEAAELARKLEAGEVEPELDHGRKVKVVDGRRFVLVNGGWIESGSEG